MARGFEFSKKVGVLTKLYDDVVRSQSLGHLYQNFFIIKTKYNQDWLKKKRKRKKNKHFKINTIRLDPTSVLKKYTHYL